MAALRAEPGRSLVALDFDGTLAPIVADPAEARAHPAAGPALARLAPRLAGIVVVTGRPAAVAAEYGALAEIPGEVTVLGHYGWDRWQAVTGEIAAPEPPAGLASVRAQLPELLTAEPGTWIEDKRLSVAVHTRGAADPQGALDRLRAPLAELAAAAGLVTEPGRLVLELRPPGMDKGTALRAHVAERRARAVLFAGDDLGDLPAFDGVRALRGQGVPGVTVASSSEEVPELSARADLLVRGPEGVVTLLEELAAELG